MAQTFVPARFLNALGWHVATTRTNHPTMFQAYSWLE